MSRLQNIVELYREIFNAKLKYQVQNAKLTHFRLQYLQQANSCRVCKIEKDKFLTAASPQSQLVCLEQNSLCAAFTREVHKCGVEL